MRRDAQKQAEVINVFGYKMTPLYLGVYLGLTNFNDYKKWLSGPIQVFLHVSIIQGLKQSCVYREMNFVYRIVTGIAIIIARTQTGKFREDYKQTTGTLFMTLEINCQSFLVNKSFNYGENTYKTSTCIGLNLTVIPRDG